ncbi:MAG: AAA family ATPase [Deltaproteobacteria bacterium]|uniref:AAA family ATPase n=1 Tax=Candidatus Zymogenus saltonus TaxID=2844893 RepID=A0A9D8PS16_9DELT|nr:AAA family ATPase [Candidatus Zymogenus saltonus]
MGNLLKPAQNRQAYAKVGIFGFQGSGKTFTSALIAIGLLRLHEKMTGRKKKCAFFDTETGSDFLTETFKKEGYELLVVKSRAFVDLKAVFGEAVESDCLVLIIDSITHVWRELTESYLRKKKQDRLYFPDWNVLKPEWGEYTDIFLNSPIHTIVCGRAGWEYETEINDKGKKESFKTGTKMKAEGEFGFEPSLVLEMIRRPKDEATTKSPGKKGTIHDNVAIVLKDRADRIDGMEFVNPTFEDFEPHWRSLNLGGEHVGVETERSSENLFKKDGESYQRKKIRREKAIEDIKNAFTKQELGTSKEAKAFCLTVLEACFGTDNSVEIRDNLPLEKLEEGARLMRESIGEMAGVFKSKGPNEKVDYRKMIEVHRDRIRKEDLAADGILDDPEDIPDDHVGGSVEDAGEEAPGSSDTLFEF